MLKHHNEYIFTANVNNFDECVIKASHSKPILVDLWAEWCSPCRVIAPVLEKIIEEYQGKIALAKVEVDDGKNMKLAGHYQVRGFPSILLFQFGEEKARFSGAKPMHFIRSFIDDHANI